MVDHEEVVQVSGGAAPVEGRPIGVALDALVRDHDVPMRVQVLVQGVLHGQQVEGARFVAHEREAPGLGLFVGVEVEHAALGLGRTA
ncbi:hypothetical protein QJ043_07305 [Olsenella sp. YH-ols2217]|uniref:Uncharacterized protein n=1 Tax=Kribbibacterium absianum TaxID=3044210 RepID=A0ABT6ZML7_9ACTN|nr:hypothetical protein [Olsenella sp. YH-ols2217]MDJ1121873.1 hypothetical protein [Olsenella sp. YH-ols2216]MDJ1129881.1 hypothetical protein [Olsenella sp. YH-ols2217]